MNHQEAGQGVTVVVRNATISGSLLAAGGTLDVEDSTVNGSLFLGPGQLRMCGNAIHGSVVESGSSAFVLVGDSGDDHCAPNSIGGSLILRDNHHGVEAVGNRVSGSVVSSNNSGTGPFPEDNAPEISNS